VDNFVEKVVFLYRREYDLFCNYMRVELSRRKKICIRAVTAVLIFVFVACGVSAPFLIEAVRESKSRNATIVVDAGHGGIDSGVTGVKTGVAEKDINLKIAFYLGEILASRGFSVVYTRRNDAMHTFDGVENNKKRADMFKRGEIINNAKPVAVVSVHQNFYSSPARRGAQVFYDKKSEEGRSFALEMQNLLNEQINLPDGKREYAPLCAKKYLLECSPYPTIIVECGFLSNFADEKNLTSQEFQYRVACVIADGITRFAR